MSDHNEKPLIEDQPEEGASIEAWQAWAHRLRKRVSTQTQEKRQLQNKITKLKKQLSTKDPALSYYKRRTMELEAELARHKEAGPLAAAILRIRKLLGHPNS